MRSQRKELLITRGSWGRLLGGGDIYIGSQWLSGSYTTWRRGSRHSCQRHRSMLWFLRLAPDMVAGGRRGRWGPDYAGVQKPWGKSYTQPAWEVSR